MQFASPLYSRAEKVASTKTKDIQIIDNPYEFGGFYESANADKYKKIHVSTEDIKERLLKGMSVHFVEDQVDRKRTIKSSWIINALKKKYYVERIDIRNAIITGDIGFQIKENLVNIDESGVEVHEINNQNDIGIENAFIISAVIDIENSQLQGSLKAGYDKNLKSIVIFEKSISFYNSTIVKKVDFVYASFKDKANFNSAIFNGEVNFRYAVFNGGADFRDTFFKRRAYFEVTRFNSEAMFINTNFKNDADFERASFKYIAHFMGARFNREAYFWETIFSEKADFTGIDFNSEAGFEYTVFNGKADFSGTRFFGEAFFSEVSFVGEADFSETSFDVDVYFSEANFKKKVNFGEVIFDGRVNFSKSNFNSDVNFRSASFYGEIDFVYSIFDGEVDFSETSFEDEAYFWETIFNGKANYIQAIFNDNVDFRNTKFIGEVDFWGANFNEIANFIETKFDGEVNFWETIFDGMANFRGTVFNSETGFEYAIFNDVTEFLSASFNSDAYFRSAVFNSETDFSSAKFNAVANFSSARFEEKAKFVGTIFSAGVNFNESNLEKADLRNANISYALLVNTNLKDAMLSGVNITGSQYEPKAPPNKTSLDGIKGLRTVWFKKGEERGLVQLRAALKESGLRGLEREATFVIKHWTTNYDSWYKRWPKRLLFGWTCGYGLNYLRPLVILLVLILIFPVPYIIALETHGRERVWKVRIGEFAKKYLEEKKPPLIKLRGLPVVGCGLYFSILSAFHFRWREINVESWAPWKQPIEYTLAAANWVKVVSGIQRLISVYLLILWLLTIFSRLFG